MKSIKKLIAVALSIILVLSCLGINVYAADLDARAITANISVSTPREGGYASYHSISNQSRQILVTDYYWAEHAPGERGFHKMSENEPFKSGCRYQIHLMVASPNSDMSNIRITINGNSPSGRSDSSNTYSHVYYDFGTLGGSSSSGGSGSSGGLGFFGILLSIVGLPVYAVLFIVSFVVGFISGIFGF